MRMLRLVASPMHPSERPFSEHCSVNVAVRHHIMSRKDDVVSVVHNGANVVTCCVASYTTHNTKLLRMERSE